MAPGASWCVLGHPRAPWQHSGRLLGLPGASWKFLENGARQCLNQNMSTSSCNYGSWGLLVLPRASWGFLGYPGASRGLLGPPGAPGKIVAAKVLSTESLVLLWGVYRTHGPPQEKGSRYEIFFYIQCIQSMHRV